MDSIMCTVSLCFYGDSNYFYISIIFINFFKFIIGQFNWNGKIKLGELMGVYFYFNIFIWYFGLLVNGRLYLDKSLKKINIQK